MKIGTNMLWLLLCVNALHASRSRPWWISPDVNRKQKSLIGLLICPIASTRFETKASLDLIGLMMCPIASTRFETKASVDSPEANQTQNPLLES